MKDLAVLLRCLQLYAHNAHNLTSGATFYADHSAFGDLYAAYETAYDSIVERIIGLGESLDLFAVQSEAAVLLLTMNKGAFTSDAAFSLLLDGERKLQAELAALNDSATIGTQNLLAQLADDSEVRSYKLQQRLS